MRLTDRIDRRRRRGDGTHRLVRDLSALNPTHHLTEPVGRGPTLERLLDRLDPAFDGRLPESFCVVGPKGAGKSAVVAALFEHLAATAPTQHGAIQTTTRAATSAVTEFAAVDARAADSEFALLRAVLAAVADDAVPERGVGTAALRDRLRDELDRSRRLVVAVDHVGESKTVTLETLDSTFEEMSSALSYVAVGRAFPDAHVESVEVPRYERHALVDVLTGRASDGLVRDGIDHETVSEVAAWADGDAHDGLAALFSAAVTATDEGATRIDSSHVTAGCDAVPKGGCSLGRVFALPASRRRVLAVLASLDPADCSSVTVAADAIAAHPSVDLSAATVKRVLYELADDGIVRRVDTGLGDDGPGRPPTRPEPNFPTTVFDRLGGAGDSVTRSER
ncbi:AAA family ATPase [Halogeometricum borinquense]|uniref:AAA family ATPase n=1 Tax=Halogeometricum borinquense TaxID=60847 RepID=A0A6C0UFL5_9EURY|nr:AAA family ATPase [Halogeometricum borinquense]QIB74246.1 AAA family ATPase [Halogeometricum borinquense]QIQ76544.1 AAA family ATPase [Halogeometricum borinquense]